MCSALSSSVIAKISSRGRFTALPDSEPPGTARSERGTGEQARQQSTAPGAPLSRQPGGRPTSARGPGRAVPPAPGRRRRSRSRSPTGGCARSSRSGPAPGRSAGCCDRRRPGPAASGRAATGGPAEASAAPDPADVQGLRRDAGPEHDAAVGDRADRLGRPLAGVVLLSTYPLAPASRQARTVAGSEVMVNTSTAQSGADRRMFRISSTPSPSGQTEVDDGQVGARGHHPLGGLRDRRGLLDPADPVLHLEQRGQAVAHHRVVVHDQDRRSGRRSPAQAIRDIVPPAGPRSPRHAGTLARSAGTAGHSTSHGHNRTVRRRRSEHTRPRERSLDLLALAATGDERSWSRLVATHRHLLRSIARGYRLSDEEAGDATQNAWVALLTRLGTLRDPRCIAGWLASTMRHECLRIIRRRARERPADDPLLVEVRAPPRTSASTTHCWSRSGTPCCGGPSTSSRPTATGAARADRLPAAAATRRSLPADAGLDRHHRPDPDACPATAAARCSWRRSRRARSN